MNIYIITPVRNGTPEMVASYVAELESEGHSVHFPPRDVDQDDPTGKHICAAHATAMLKADRVDIFWDKTSSGSHFDLGMAYILGKKMKMVHEFQEDGTEKSYAKVIRSCT